MLLKQLYHYIKKTFFVTYITVSYGCYLVRQAIVAFTRRVGAARQDGGPKHSALRIWIQCVDPDPVCGSGSSKSKLALRS